MTAAMKLTPAIAAEDPLWRKFLAAPVDPNPLSEEELSWMEQAKVSGVVSGAVVSSDIARRAERDSEPNVEQ